MCIFIDELNLTKLHAAKRNLRYEPWTPLKWAFLEKLIPLLTGYKESIYHLLHPPKCSKQLIMSQSTSPLSFFTYHTLIFPYLKQESTYLCTCIVEKSILEFGTAISAVLITDYTLQDFMRMTLPLRPLSGSAFQVITIAVYPTSISQASFVEQEQTLTYLALLNISKFTH